MGQVKQALIEVDDLVCGCLQQRRTLNQTIRDLRELYDNKKIDNPYLLNEDLIEDKYYQFRGE
jgi:archaellum component FlaC